METYEDDWKTARVYGVVVSELADGSFEVKYPDDPKVYKSAKGHFQLEGSRRPTAPLRRPSSCGMAVAPSAVAQSHT